MIRTDSPTGSRDIFPGTFLRSTGALELWFCRCRFCIFASRRNRTVAIAHDAKTSTATRMCARGSREYLWNSRRRSLLVSNTYVTNLGANFESMRVLWRMDSISMSSMVDSPVSRSPMSMNCSTRMALVATPPSRCWMPLRKSLTCLESWTISCVVAEAFV